MVEQKSFSGKEITIIWGEPLFWFESRTVKTALQYFLFKTSCLCRFIIRINRISDTI